MINLVNWLLLQSIQIKLTKFVKSNSPVKKWSLISKIGYSALFSKG